MNPKETYVVGQRAFVPRTAEDDSFSGDPLLVAPVPRVLFRAQSLEHSLILNANSEWAIGRSKENEIVLIDRLTSRRHALIKAVTPTQFSLIDLESRNGLFLNQHRVTQAVNLKHGDRITVGETELYFRCPSGSVSLSMADSTAPKTVLMSHADRIQGKIWREILSSQGVSVVWPEKHEDLVPSLSHLQGSNRLPKLLLIDLAAANNNPYEFCRWCRETYPQSQIFLLSSTRTDIYESERRWAIRQGVSELFPAFALQKLFSNIADIAVKVRQVLKVVNSPPLEHSSLVFTLLGLQEQIRNYDLD